MGSKDILRALKRFRRISGVIEEVSKVSKGCPMTSGSQVESLGITATN